jgi:hypothetical protein
LPFWAAYRPLGKHFRHRESDQPKKAFESEHHCVRALFVDFNGADPVMAVFPGPTHIVPWRAARPVPPGAQQLAGVLHAEPPATKLAWLQEHGRVRIAPPIPIANLHLRR